MCHKKIRIPRENANQIMRALGNLEIGIEFVDLTKDDIEAKKNFGSMLKRCEEINKKILDIENICQDFHQSFKKYKLYQPFQKDLQNDMEERDKKLGSTYFDLVESEIIENDRKIKELVNSHSQIREDLINLIEKKYVLKKTSELTFSGGQFSNDFADIDPNNEGIKMSSSNLNFIAGVVSASEELKMKRMIFRVSRGRAITTFYDLAVDREEYLFTTSIKQRGFSFADSPDNLDNEGDKSQMIKIKPLDEGVAETRKKIFNIIFQGGEENVLLGKILKVCEIFQASRYGVPKNSELDNEISKLERDIYEKKQVLIKTETNIRDILSKTIMFKDKPKYSMYQMYFMQERMIYATLNKCILRDNFIDGEVWIPKGKMDNVTNLLQKLFSGQDKLTANIQDLEDESDKKPPTFIQSNEFLWAFQEIVNTYGIPRYREINPAYFNVITFPFLFGVMFGDVGHGLILFLASAYMCKCKESLEKNNSIIKPILKGRYLLLLMGFFALFCGFLYNDFLSIPLQFGTCFENNSTNPQETILKENCTYSFGIDPKWFISTNELAFTNSLKMKLSVILGVAHMGLGVFLKGLNAIYQKNFVDLLFVFVPQIILLLVLFGYMDLLIILKWNKVFEHSYDAPDIKSIMMNIFLSLGKNPEGAEFIWGPDDPQTKEKGAQSKFHLAILGIVAFCVLVMLLPKSLFDYTSAKKQYSHRQMRDMNVNLLDQPLLMDEGPNEPPQLSEIVVHVLIDTIEFILGTVSNTASYLRLWALSLAHGQLSKVFFEYGILSGTKMTSHFFINAISVSLTYILFAYVTIGVLLFMDLMECFLHTLRLHWVEFQNKFFSADGYEFTPFCFRKVFTATE